MTGYEIYSAWCRERGQVPPTKEWWDKACSKPYIVFTPTTGDGRYREILDDQREIDRERRDGWSTGND